PLPRLSSPPRRSSDLYTDTGLSASTSYSYRVQASGPGGSSPYSNTASATTLPPPPTAPSSLTAAAASSSQINLAWTAAAVRLDGDRKSTRLNSSHEWI